MIYESTGLWSKRSISPSSLVKFSQYQFSATRACVDVWTALQALLLSHPRKMTRDTATYPPLMMSIGKGQKAKPRALRHLAETELGLSIQAGEHSPIDDARSALYLYHKHRKVGC